MTLFLIIITLYQGEIIDIDERQALPGSTMEMCLALVEDYKQLELPEGYEIRSYCEERD